MTVTLKHLDKLNSNNNNFFIFVSNLSQLKTLILPFKINNLIKNTEFVRKLTNNKSVEINNFLEKPNFLINFKIFLIEPKLSDSIKFLKLGAKILSNNKKNKLEEVTFIFSNFLISNNKKVIADIIFGYQLKSYVFNKYLSHKKNNLNDILLNLYNLKKIKEINYNNNLLFSINFSKNLIAEPANIINPVSFSKKCLELKKYGLKIKVINLSQIKKIGMNALLGVSQGSANEPRVVIFEWNIKKNKKPIILAGKGVTFDTGGISLKPSSGMEEMIIDMSGSAVVVGSMINAALNKSKKSIVGIVGLVENMPDGKAQRPGDIVNSLSGKTIEVLNTDAEGRLVLADILTYVQSKYSPNLIIDFATLTGAILIALGSHHAGLFSNNISLSNKLIKAGKQSGEKLWQMPLGDEYNSEIDSKRADIKNIGSSRYGGSTHAAHFIERFINKNTNWAHLDIAGVSWTSNPEQNSFSSLHSHGPTGFGIRLIDEFLKGK